MAATARPSLPRRIAGIIAKTLAGLLLALVLAVLGAFFWLRTDAAARFIAETASGLLSGMGLHLEMQSVRGPLPSRLVITGLVLSDDEGPLAKAGTITLETELGALLSGSLVVPLIGVDQPELIRLPALPEDDAPQEESGGLPAIPVDIVLKEITISRGTLHTAALMPPAQDPAPERAFPQTLSVALSGSAALRSLNLDARLGASLKDPAGQGVRLDLGLTSGIERLFGTGAVTAQPGADELDLALAAAEGPARSAAGPVAALLGMPDFPGYALHLSGKGPVNDWQGTLQLAYGSSGVDGFDPATPIAGADETDAFAPRNAVLLAEAAFGLECRTGS